VRGVGGGLARGDQSLGDAQVLVQHGQRRLERLDHPRHRRVAEPRALDLGGEQAHRGAPLRAQQVASGLGDVAGPDQCAVEDRLEELEARLLPEGERGGDVGREPRLPDEPVEGVVGRVVDQGARRGRCLLLRLNRSRSAAATADGAQREPRDDQSP
jgi:hypothetical protein